MTHPPRPLQGSHRQARRPWVSLSVRLLKGAVKPTIAAELARLRQSEVAFAQLTPRPLVVVVLGVASKTGSTSLAALIAQALAALAPGRVVVLDGDSGTPSTLRARLDTGSAGDLRQLVRTREVWTKRRLVDRFLARDGMVPLLATESSHSARPIPPHELDAAVQLLKRRFPVVLVDLPARTDGPTLTWASRIADQVIVVGPQGHPYLRSAPSWLVGNRAGRALGVTVVSVQKMSGPLPQAGVDVTFSADAALSRQGPARLADVQLPTLATVEEIVVRVTTTWRERLRVETT